MLARESKQPLFRVVCSAFPESPQGKLRLPGVDATWVEDWINDVSRPDLYMVMWERPTTSEGQGSALALTCHAMHKQGVFEPETAAAMIKLLEAVLDAMMRDTAQTASALLATC